VQNALMGDWAQFWGGAPFEPLRAGKDKKGGLIQPVMKGRGD